MKWEYKQIERPSHLDVMAEYDLNDLGNYGWELVTIIRQNFNNQIVYIFKRLKEN